MRVSVQGLNSLGSKLIFRYSCIVARAEQSKLQVKTSRQQLLLGSRPDTTAVPNHAVFDASHCLSTEFCNNWHAWISTTREPCCLGYLALKPTAPQALASAFPKRISSIAQHVDLRVQPTTDLEHISPWIVCRNLKRGRSIICLFRHKKHQRAIEDVAGLLPSSPKVPSKLRLS